jgi:hypothetical protein
MNSTMPDPRPSQARLRTFTQLAFIVVTLASCGEGDQRNQTADDEGATLESERATAALAEPAPIVAVAHGVALLANGKWSRPSDEVARSAHDFYLARIEGQANAEAKAKIDKKKTELAARLKLPGADGVTARAELLSTLLDDVKPEDEPTVREINAYLRSLALPDTLVGSSKDTSIGQTQQGLVTTASGTAYRDECLAKGVPHPPSWGTTGWIDRGVLTVDILTPPPNTLTKVYTWESTSPRGLCIALPRYTNVSGTTIDLLGIICQGNDTSRSCFWDSKKDIDIPTGATVAIPSALIVGGADLVNNGQGVCTNCHAGENNFIVHPGTALDRGDPLVRANGWVSPILVASWNQNRGPGHELERVSPTTDSGSCLSCHNKSMGKRFPKGRTGSEYCSIAEQLVGKTMPMPNPALFANYSTHRAAIANMCGLRALVARFGTATIWHDFFGPIGEVPMMGDFNGDGRSDIVSFVVNGNNDAWVSLSTGTSFGGASKWHDYFGLPGEQLDVGDFNGDGRDDIVVFPKQLNGHVWVATSSGTSFSGVSDWFGQMFAGQVAATGDFNNDRKDDIAVFTKGSTNDVLVALSNGTSFGPMLFWHDFFAIDAEIPATGDFDGDGYDDIVTFTRGSSADVWVALSTGSSFGASSLWHSDFVGATDIPRVADVNGDGRDDVISFVRGSSGDVWVALSDGTSFKAAQLYHDWMGIGNEVTFVADVNADDRADAVVFTQGSLADVYVAPAAGVASP